MCECIFDLVLQSMLWYILSTNPPAQFVLLIPPPSLSRYRVSGSFLLWLPECAQVTNQMKNYYHLIALFKRADSRACQRLPNQPVVCTICRQQKKFFFLFGRREWDVKLCIKSDIVIYLLWVSTAFRRRSEKNKTISFRWHMFDWLAIVCFSIRKVINDHQLFS